VRLGLIGCHGSLDWTYRGMRTLILENHWLRVVSLVDKGSDIMELIYKPLDIDLLFHTPIGHQKPGSIVGSIRRSEGEFLEYYGGGWQDILPFAGNDPVRHRFGEWGMHGETSLLPWNAYIEKESPSEVTAKLSVDLPRYPFHVEKWITISDDSATFSIREKLTNTSNQTLEYCWLQHPAFGRPFVGPGTKVIIPAQTLLVDKPEPLGRLKAESTHKWPHAEDKSGKSIDMSVLPGDEVVVDETVFIKDLKEPWYAIVNPDLKLGFALRWDQSVFPFLWFCESFWAPDHPWFGAAYGIILEPCTGYPVAAEQLRRGTIKKLRGKTSIETTLTATVFRDIENVKTVEPDGRVVPAQSGKNSQH